MSTIHVLYRAIETEDGQKLDRLVAWYQFAEKATKVADDLNDAIGDNEDPLAALAILTKVDPTASKHIGQLTRVIYYTLPVEQGE